MNWRYIAIIILFSACADTQEVEKSAFLFSKMETSHTGIDFTNQLEYDEDFNIYTYRNFYNGGGVGLGDFNNDGLQDVYFTANMHKNKLFINKGDFKFEDITKSAGVGGDRSWSTGVSIVDINGDGWMDIYVCNSGDIEGDNKQNELFINQGNLTFVESAEEYGLADAGYSTHAAFFDYDKDGDIDVYLLNNSYQAIGSFSLTRNERPNRDPVGGDKFYRNDNGIFRDVSEEVGIFGSIIGFGLGVTVGDLNLDGWQDIFISNDFFERDYIYINNGDGTFSEDLENEMRSISAASMGADLADINNDGYPDLFVTEMLPEPDARIKTVTTFEDWDKYQYNIQNGYYHQFTRNMLQLNNGDMSFSEIGRLADVEATDWSWGALIADYDNDGLKDIFVANGIYQDLTNQDYIQFISNEETMMSIIEDNGVNYEKLIDAIPSVKIPNYCFKNEGNLVFNNMATEWGLDEPSHSNGSAYGDLDNDGDLDLVVNNVNMPAYIYRNETSTKENNNYLKIILKGIGGNTNAVGAKVKLVAGDDELFQEQIPVRGFQSSMDNRMNFGLGGIKTLDSILVYWNDKQFSYSLQTNVSANQTITIDQKNALGTFKKSETIAPIQFKELMSGINIDYKHMENDFVDFNRHRLIFHMLSTEGPKIARGDVNGDGNTDLYLGGAKGQPGQLMIQTRSGSFVSSQVDIFQQDNRSEDRDAVFFDYDGDGDQDLYVASGGYEFSSNSITLLDRIYENDGRGNFTKGKAPLKEFISTSCVRPYDMDNDGDEDLFIGNRYIPYLYGVPASSYFLENDGKGNYLVSAVNSEVVKDLGMVTDAEWEDIDGDGDKDLIVVGEWMPITVFQNSDGKMTKLDLPDLDKSNGWWNSLEPGDIDNDGDIDFVIGNHGLNSRFKATKDKPVSMYINDFDQNGTPEQVVTCYNGDSAYSMALKHDLVMQMPVLKKKYLKYENYVRQTINDIFTAEQLENAIRLDAYNFGTSVMINNGQGSFQLKELPVTTQLAPIYGILVKDLDSDGNKDILLGGNLYSVKPEVGRYDASYGVFLKGDGSGNFTTVDKKQSGFNLEGETRDIESIEWMGKELILVSRNNDSLQVFENTPK